MKWKEKKLRECYEALRKLGRNNIGSDIWQKYFARAEQLKIELAARYKD